MAIKTPEKNKQPSVESTDEAAEGSIKPYHNDNRDKSARNIISRLGENTDEIIEKAEGEIKQKKIKARDIEVSHGEVSQAENSETKDEQIIEKQKIELLGKINQATSLLDEIKNNPNSPDRKAKLKEYDQLFEEIKKTAIKLYSE